MSASVRLRYATREDLDVLLEIQHSAAEAPQWGEALWRSMLEKSAQPRVILMASDPEAQELPCGLIVLHLIANIAELENLAVKPAFRRRGIGRALCEGGFGWARVSKAASIELEVRASNATAITLYRSFGFAEQGRRRGYYEKPVEDAILMARKL